MTLANRARRSRKKQRAELNENILTQLEFIKPFIIKNGYFVIKDGFMIGLNEMGEYAVVKTQLSFNAAPNFDNFKAAIEECSEEVTLTVLNEKELNIVSDEFSIIINCDCNLLKIDFSELNYCFPEYAMQESLIFKQCLQKALLSLKIINKTQPALSNKLVLKQDCIIASNGNVLIAAPTKENLPSDLWVSKQAAIVLAKSEKEIKAIGCNGAYVAFHFKDSSFYVIKLVEFEAVDFSSILCTIENDKFKEPPVKFFEIVKDASKFSNKEFVVFENDKVSIEDLKAKASFTINENFDKIGFKVKYLLNIEPIATKLYFNERSMVFTDGHCYGVLAGLDFGKHYEKSSDEEIDDDIPF